MAVNSFTYNLDEILTTTLLNYRKNGQFYDNIFKTNPTMWILHEKGRKQDWRGGERVICNLQYGKNTTIGSYSRYGTIDTTPQDNQTAAYYAMKQLGGSITIDRFSMQQNRGKYELQDLLKVKINEAEMSMAEEINTQLWRATQADSNDILGIPNIVYRSPNSGDTDPGGIAADGAGNSWWQNRYKIDVDIDTFAELRYWMRHVYNDCTKGAAMMGKKGTFIGNAPDVTIMSQGVYEAYESDLDSRSRYVNAWSQKAISYGFDSVSFKRSAVLWDEMVGDAYTNTSYPTANTEDSLYFLNTNFLHYYVDPATDLLVGKFIEPVNQDARTAKILHYHALACSNRSKQGVIGYINSAITS